MELQLFFLQGVTFRGKHLINGGNFFVINDSKDELNVPSDFALLRAKRNLIFTEQLKSLGLSERQIITVEFLKVNKKITHKDYQLLTGLSKETSSPDLKI